MADICVIYASDDRETVKQLVTLLRKHWDVWWADGISHGDWEKYVKEEICKARAVLPVISPKIGSKDIFRGELDYALEKNDTLFPFLIAPTDLPLAIRHRNRTEAFGWKGEINHVGYKELVKKLGTELGRDELRDVRLGRQTELVLGLKVLRLPCFVFSVSSHETQLTPKNGIDLLKSLSLPAGLVSAYDVWEKRNSQTFMKALSALCESDCAMFLDSGNYESSRKNDRYGKKNPNGWNRTKFREVLKQSKPDLVFSFDTPDPKGKAGDIVRRVINAYRRDQADCEGMDRPVCPVIHLSKKDRNGPEPGRIAAEMVTEVASTVDPLMLSIPERELGDGIIARVQSVQAIRKALNNTGKYYPLHLLGTGNPTSVVAFAFAVPTPSTGWSGVVLWPTTETGTCCISSSSSW